MPSRLRRSSAFYFVLVIVLGIVFWITFQGINTSRASLWSYSQLVTQAQQGNVKSLEIRGKVGTAQDKAGRRHAVDLPPNTEPLATRLAEEGVSVRYSPASDANWLLVLLPNLILLVVIAGFMYYLYRQRRFR